MMTHLSVTAGSGSALDGSDNPTVTAVAGVPVSASAYTSSTQTVFDFALLLVGMSYFYDNSTPNATGGTPYREAYFTVTNTDIANADGLNIANGSKAARDAWLLSASNTKAQLGNNKCWNDGLTAAPPTANAGAKHLYDQMLGLGTAGTNYDPEECFASIAVPNISTPATLAKPVMGLQNAIMAIALNYRNTGFETAATQLNL